MKAHPFQYPGNTYILVKMECYKGKQSYDCHFCCCEFFIIYIYEHCIQVLFNAFYTYHLFTTCFIYFDLKHMTYVQKNIFIKYNRNSIGYVNIHK
ncbi:MAG: hypothetical protein EGP87_13325 [Paraprevotella clara]|nr:hypothetical protein [Paraprevotella clara]